MRLLKKQRGDLLIDGLVSMFICSILAVGLTLGIAASYVSQARMEAQNEAVEQIRQSIVKIGVDNICNGVKLPNVVLKNKESLPVNVECAKESIRVGNQTNNYDVEVVKGKASVTSAQYFGMPGTIVVSL